jgi:hypothetical protein
MITVARRIRSKSRQQASKNHRYPVSPMPPSPAGRLDRLMKILSPLQVRSTSIRILATHIVHHGLVPVSVMEVAECRLVKT